MSATFNIYCDESCHLEHDRQKVMVLGAVWCPLEKTREISQRIREIKERHGLPTHFEIKWIKVSPAKQAFYLDLLDYFFDDDDLHFRALIVPDKAELQQQDAMMTHDNWYYTLYFELLKVLLQPGARHRIYIDIKDTRGASKLRLLHRALSNSVYDFQPEIIERIEQVHSHQIAQMQLADLLIGIVSYANRGLEADPRANAGKVALLERMRQRSHYALTRSTLLQEPKVNLYRWHAKDDKGL
jgi:hypothetical protein